MLVAMTGAAEKSARLCVFDTGDLSASSLLAVLRALEGAFLQTPGRCEVRCGGGRVYLDVAVANRDGSVARVCEAIHETLPAHEATLHKGKAQVDVHPIARADATAAG
jgi:hypothetical protein